MGACAVPAVRSGLEVMGSDVQVSLGGTLDEAKCMKMVDSNWGLGISGVGKNLPHQGLIGRT